MPSLVWEQKKNELTRFQQFSRSTGMAIRPIIKLPDARLKLVSKPVEVFDDGLRALANDMLDTIYDAPGIGLAAIQIALPLRLIVVDVAPKEEPRAPIILANAEIVWQSEELSTYQEGCLSIPEYYADVDRPARVRVRYQDEFGAAQEIEADGLLATCLQHEIDHMNGVLFIDHISKLKRDRVVKKFSKAARLEQASPAA